MLGDFGFFLRQYCKSKILKLGISMPDKLDIIYFVNMDISEVKNVLGVKQRKEFPFPVSAHQGSILTIGAFFM